MEPQETFTNKVMRRPSVQAKLLMKVEPLEVELKGWGKNAFKVPSIYLQQREQERTNMSMSTQRHGILYRSKEILHTYQEVQGGMETISIDKGST